MFQNENDHSTYVAPEILKNIPHDDRVDLWSIGVVTFVLLVGYPPFLEDNQSALFEKIRTGEWEFIEGDWRFMSLVLIFVEYTI